MELRPIEGNKDLVRDLTTGAILNVNKEAFAGSKNVQDNLEKRQNSN